MALAAVGHLQRAFVVDGFASQRPRHLGLYHRPGRFANNVTTMSSRRPLDGLAIGACIGFVCKNASYGAGIVVRDLRWHIVQNHAKYCLVLKQ